MVKFCMISQPMNGLTDEEISETHDRAIKAVKELGYEFMKSYFVESFRVNEDGSCDVNIPVHFLAKAINVMSKCTAVYFCKGWKDARGCIIEHEIATRYGYECIYEE